MKQTDLAVVLSRISYSENSIIVKVFTKESGLQSFLVQGAKKKKGVHFFPLELMEIEFFKRNENQLGKLTSIESTNSLLEIISNPLKSSIAFFVAEVLSKMLRENHPDKKLFHFLQEEITWLNHSEEMGNYLIWFLAQLTIIEGFQPEIYDMNPRYFELQDGKFCNSLPFNPAYLEESWLHWLTDSLTEEKLIFLSTPIPKEERQLALDAWIHYFEFHVTGFKNIKSLEIIRTVFYS